MSARPKEFRFPVDVVAEEGRRVLARVDGKADLLVAPPPEFRGTDPTVWSPEDLFVGSVATCLAVTFGGLAQRAGLPVRTCAVAGEGVVGQRADGRFGFTSVLLRMRVETDAGAEEQARELAWKAEETCLVSVSLDLPVELELELATG